MTHKTGMIFGIGIFLSVAATGFVQTIDTDFSNYSDGSQAMTATPGTQGGSLGAVWNPAAWAAMRGFEFAFSWNDRNVAPKRLDNWGFYAGGHGIGFSMRRTDAPFHGPDESQGDRLRVDDYSLAIGGGNRADYWGLAYGWSKGDTEFLSRDNTLTLGNITRPCRHVSIGGAASLGINKGDVRGISDLGVRPFGTRALTFFADAAYARKHNPTTMYWGIGAEVMPLNGVRIAAKMTKPEGFSQDKILSVSLGLTLDDIGFHVTPHYDKDSDLSSTSYTIRLGDLAPSFDVDSFIDQGAERVLAMTMKGRLTYQTSRWYDPERHALRELLNKIENAKEDRRVDGIALNLSGLTGTREMLWEVREKLMEFRESGKKVYIYFDRAGMSLYYFASCADYLWIDPQGGIIIPGLLAGRTFWKGFLEKIGLGVEEWRYFDYKSAFESLARREMSEKDREQRLALIEDFYAEWERGITNNRDLTSDELRMLVDSIGYIRAGEALETGLVDAVGRWDDAVDYVEVLSGREPDFIDSDEIEDDRFADQSWGELPKIAVVYAIGECDMDTGIRGRYTSRLLRKLAKNNAIDAVVLRVDSPGGDALPSDLVAAEMTTVSERKPMIVSQGSVAASGGYWISMNADKIYTSPFSVTGSIGVIAGWVWNQGLTEKTGFTFDYVKVGEHAELGAGVRLPLIGITVPDRPLDEYEKSRMERVIREHYGEFVGFVAQARGLDTAYVESVAQGRVWSGTAAVENNLVDEYGGLTDAIEYAKLQAGFKKRRKVEIIEYPRRGWFNFDRLFAPASPIRALLNNSFMDGREEAAETASDYELSFLRRIASTHGRAVLMISPEDIPVEDER